MSAFWRKLTGCGLRERRADDMAHRQAEDHAITMQAMDLRLRAAEAAAKESERAAQALLRLLEEDLPQ